MRNTTARWPGVMLTGCNDVSDVMCEIRPRNGMTSPNGTSWRFTYMVVGPRPGSQSWPTLRTGCCRSSPTRIGRPIAFTAAAVSWWVKGDSKRVQVGGVLRPDHKVGCGPVARPHLGGELLGGGRVVLRDLGVVEQRGQVP